MRISQRGSLYCCTHASSETSLLPTPHLHGCVLVGHIYFLCVSLLAKLFPSAGSLPSNGKAGTRCFSQVSHMGAEVQGRGPSSAAFTVTLAGSSIRSQDSHWHRYGGEESVHYHYITCQSFLGLNTSLAENRYYCV